MEVNLPSEPEVPLHEPLAWRTQLFEPLDFLVLPGPPAAVGELTGKNVEDSVQFISTNMHGVSCSLSILCPFQK